MTALYFILGVITFYYVFKFSMRLLLPYAMKKLTERMMNKAQQGRGGFTYTYTSGNPFGPQSTYQDNNQQQNKSNGQVQVDYVPPREEKRTVAPNAGEFIDFEEVK
ncbi:MULTISPECIES: DUF4834 family protein [Sphingobacterium]|uniref:DUF4834 family protein n=1 Tax=Sphingobacterium litopenaei TaxID=2763500 RepID=A0ABR7YHE2_9SPHI|nr:MULTISPECIES: DUF4834 family protein [Sphingobacterium]MBD1430733.1 DUF4834 family protein [Sphingobacterium litopenaei]NGM72600.1 DUF4834 family protein [Sphingobacterium sp. SGL-16]